MKNDFRRCESAVFGTEDKSALDSIFCFIFSNVIYLELLHLIVICYLFG